jgi:hypothetical protein
MRIRSMAATLAGGVALLAGMPPTAGAVSAASLLAWLRARIRGLRPAARTDTGAMPSPRHSRSTARASVVRNDDRWADAAHLGYLSAASGAAGETR